MKFWSMTGVWMASVLWCTGGLAAPWEPARAPLMTRWAEDVSPDHVHPEYPRPLMVRSEWLNLNGLWQFGPAAPGQEPPVGRELSARILVPFPVESALSGVMRRHPRVWYRRTFQVPEGWQGRRVLLHFQAVDWEATVWLNGHRLGAHRGGYDGFSFDVTDALRPEGSQELIVGVFDPSDGGDQPRGKQVNQPRGIWYTPSTGIWQTVWLEPVPQTYIRGLAIVPDVDGRSVRLRADVAGPMAGHQIEAEVELPGGTAGPGGRLGRARGEPGSELRISMPADMRLWSPEDPYLYRLTVRLLAGQPAVDGGPVDEVRSYVGMRKVDLAKDQDGFLRIRLNGRFVFQMGPLDQGFWPDGLYTAPTDEALRYDIEMIKQLGFNMARKHVKIEPERWYYWCDRLGLLVWQDMPNGNNSTPESRVQFERELTRLVEGRGNHPSIIMWIVFNEGWGQHDTERYVAKVRRLDPTRLVSCASGWKDVGAGHILDIHRYPGPAAPEPQPERATVLGEFGGLGLGVDGHTWAPKSWGYRGTESSEELTRRYEHLLRRVWGYQKSHGLSAAVYTQITDVETECNGLLTYDRAVVKVDVARVAAANRGRVPKLEVLVPTSQAEGIPWRYTFSPPDEGWTKRGFDDSAWSEGPGGFGTPKTPGAVVRTEWSGPEIWLRRWFTLPEVGSQRLAVLVHHDEDVEIYFNGVLAVRQSGHTVDYEELPVRPEARRALKAGRNLMAVHCRQTRGGQYIDVGIARVVMPER
ncbi:MAG TPA: glycoside hydrolase family 2 [Planctomycetaceae bacterium]|nr:glycoside hydrolase family 2 [Planctomycetaceae bacterium]